MERRSLLKMIGGIGVTAGASGAGVLAMSGGASATAVTNEYGDVTVTSDDGTVEYVAIYGESVVEWDGFDSTATSFQLIQEARIPGQVGWMQLNDTGEVDLSNDDWGGATENTSDPGTSGTIETGIGVDRDGNHTPSNDWHVVGSDPDGYGLPNNSLDPSNLEVDGDGDTGNFTIEIRETIYWYDANNNEIFNKSFTADVNVTVNNEESEATATDSNTGATGA